MKKWMGLVLLLLVCLLFLACSKMSKKGTPPANKAPEVFLTNIPPDSSNFSTLAKIYWYGFDQDGYIASYQYLIIPDTGAVIPKTGGYIDSLFVKSIERVSPEDWKDSSLSVILGINRDFIHAEDSTGTWDNVMLFASVDSTRYVAQYFFVRGVDNEGACSRIWKSGPGEMCTFRWFTRNNRPPVTKVTYSYKTNETGNFLDTLISEYCLPETTIEWKGLKISWSAEDPDYSVRSQPSFNYFWVLLGPFPDSVTSIDTTKIYYSSWDSTTGIPWVDSTSRLLVDLENAEGRDYGWYQFRVWARDDAFVPDPSPATVTFKIIKPPFLFSENDSNYVLLVDATAYDGRVAIPNRDTLHSFYKRLLDSLVANGTIKGYSLFRPSTAPYNVNYVYPVPEDTLSHYKLVIFFNEGLFSGIQGYGVNGVDLDTGFIHINRYLRVGGRVWMIGQNNFGLDDPGVPSYMPINPVRAYGYTVTTGTLANYYFGVTGMFHPSFASGKRNEEMIAAEPYNSAYHNLPLLEVDTARLKLYRGVTGLKGIPRANWESVWNNYYNERLYTFISYQGSESSLHGRACASRAYDPYPWVFYEDGNTYTLCWKTAEFCFPSLAMKESQMLEMMKVMVNWFMSDEANP